ncbi:MAG: hypothetical protein OXD29_07235 [Roseovarius sp.]|nr:hypothetical protein [Roseovarius sp.]
MSRSLTSIPAATGRQGDQGMEPKARAAVNIPPKAVRHINRSTVERVNARLKDEFGVLALAIDQLQRHMPRLFPFRPVFGRPGVWTPGAGDACPEIRRIGSKKGLNCLKSGEPRENRPQTLEFAFPVPLFTWQMPFCRHDRR